MSIFEKDLDYTSLIKTDEFRKYMSTLPLTMSFNQIAAGFPINIIGDLTEIKIFGRNEMFLIVMYDLVNTEPSYARIEVKDDTLKQEIRQKFRTNRGVNLRVKCTSNGVDTFELVDIIEYDNICNYGQWICSECGYNYRFDNPDGHGCCVCEGKIEQVFDFYK